MKIILTTSISCEAHDFKSQTYRTQLILNDQNFNITLIFLRAWQMLGKTKYIRELSLKSSFAINNNNVLNCHISLILLWLKFFNIVGFVNKSLNTTQTIYKTKGNNLEIKIECLAVIVIIFNTKSILIDINCTYLCVKYL